MTAPQPNLVILGGINGAGKTTTAEAVAQFPELVDAIFLNPDKVTAAIRAADPGLPQAQAEFRGMRKIAERIGDLLRTRTPFVTETVLASRSYRRIATDAASLGYRIRLFWVGLRSIEHSIARVALRVTRGGHNVTEADIRRRWPATHENLAWFAQHADEVQVFDNSREGGPPRLIATARAGIVTLRDRDALPEVTRVLAPLASH